MGVDGRERVRKIAKLITKQWAQRSKVMDVYRDR